ncbi:MAG: ribosomal-processing cysteine protease Prp [Lachnospiraceae bacterium]|nr:ribosomal-processing cysteine protease Prp [Lachnospiraceae bacterium]
MTTISFYLDEHDKLMGFEAKDHAGFANSGKDIVCSAISVLTINTINSFDELLHADVSLKSDETTGYIDFKVTDYDNESAQLLLKSLKLGLEGVCESYPKYLKLTNRRCKP